MKKTSPFGSGWKNTEHAYKLASYLWELKDKHSYTNSQLVPFASKFLMTLNPLRYTAKLRKETINRLWIRTLFELHCMHKDKIIKKVRSNFLSALMNASSIHEKGTNVIARSVSDIQNNNRILRLEDLKNLCIIVSKQEELLTKSGFLKLVNDIHDQKESEEESEKESESVSNVELKEVINKLAIRQKKNINVRVKKIDR